jgi:hypothetical protein
VSRPAARLTCTFARGAWDPADWWMVRSPRFDHGNDWIQEADHIRNDGPETEPGQTYTSMVWAAPLVVDGTGDDAGELTVSATMSFDERMAPLIALGPEPALRADGVREYREHVELVLFDEGLNLWHHVWSADDGPSWRLAAKWRFAVEARRRYRLSLRRSGTVPDTRLEARLDGQRVGEIDLPLPGPLHAGITACEGTNRFYDIAIEGA